VSNSRSRIPQHRRHKGKGLGYVRINGRMLYTGKWGSDEANEKARRLVSRFLAGVEEIGPDEGRSNHDLTVSGLSARYWQYFEEAYRGSREPESLRHALRAIVGLFGDFPAGDFRPRHLKAIREAMIASGLSRTTINRRETMIKRMFRWGVEEELVSPLAAEAVRAVESLKARRSRAKEPVPVRPVERADVDAVLGHVSRQVAAMIELQWLTGMRPGEVTRMKPAELDRSTETWSYSPSQHKNLHRGHSRVIGLGPQCQEILRPFLLRPADSFLFSPKDADEEWRRSKRAARKSKVTPSQLARQRRAEREARSKLGNKYDVRAYARAIARGCVKAGVRHWAPNQLRHAAATRFRREYGLDVARALLGHRSPRVTEIYAELDYSAALRVMGEIG
jgi:integrase